MGVAHFVSRRGQAGGKARFGCLVKQLSSEVVTYFAINIWKLPLVGLLIPKIQLAFEWPLVWEGYELCLLRLRHRACRRFSSESSVRGMSSAVLPGAYAGAQRWDVPHLRPMCGDHLQTAEICEECWAAGRRKPFVDSVQQGKGWNVKP